MGLKLGGSSGDLGVKYRALLLANWQYEYLPGLYTPKSDLEVIRAALSNPDYGLFAGEGDIEEHVNLPLAQMRLAIEAFIAGSQVDDSLLIYFSGHEAVTSFGTLALCAIETSPEDIDLSALDTQFLAGWINRRAGLPPTLIVLDCAVDLPFDTRAEPARTAVIDTALPDGVLVLASGQRTPAFETADESHSSPFTAALASILVDPKVPGDEEGRLTGGRVAELLQEAVPGPVRPFWAGRAFGSIVAAKRPVSRAGPAVAPNPHVRHPNHDQPKKGAES